MLEPELFYIFTRRLNEAAINCMVTGSAASIIYGQPRLTHDVDFVVELAAADLPRISEDFPSAEFYCPPLEVMRTEINRENRGHFNIIHHQTGFKADIDRNDGFRRFDENKKLEKTKTFLGLLRRSTSLLKSYSILLKGVRPSILQTSGVCSR